MFVPTKDHNHAVRHEEIKRSETLNHLKDGVRSNPTATLKETYDAVSIRRKSLLGQDFNAFTLPTFNEIRTVMRHEKNKHLPSLPTTIAEIPSRLTNEMKMIQREIGQADEFVFMDGDIVMLTTRNMLEQLENAAIIYMDGTFYVTPSLFSQVYSIHIMVENTMICCAYFLLPGKSKDIYVKMLPVLQQRCLLNPEGIQTDFELAAIQAASQLHPNAKIKGCFFHFTQCVWRKVQDIGLSGEYNKNQPQVVKFVRRMAGLPMLKPDDVVPAFHSAILLINNVEEENSERIQDKLNQLKDYMFNTWIKADARFPVCLWTRYEVSGPRTNNHLEGYHSGLKKAIKVAHPNIFVFIEAIKVEQKKNEVKLGQALSGGQVSQPRGNYVRLEKKIQDRIAQYSSGLLTIDNFLDQIGCLFKLQA